MRGTRALMHGCAVDETGNAIAINIIIIERSITLLALCNISDQTHANRQQCAALCHNDDFRWAWDTHAYVRVAFC